MNRIFAGEVYEVVPQPNGLIFSYCKDAGREHVLVAYKMLSLETGQMTDIAKNIYQLSKFGSNYRAVATVCDNYITARALILPNGKVFLAEDTGRASLFESDGVLLWQGAITYHGTPPADVAIYKNTLWACYADSNVLIRFNLMTLREELRIGGSNSPFNQPRHLFIKGDDAMVSNSGSNKLLSVNLNSYTVLEYKEFSEPVYSYVKVRDYGFVLMKSGLYVL